MTAARITVTVDRDLEDLVPGFLENRRKDVESLRQAAAAGQAETLRSIGHTLKGVGGGYGFHELSEIGAAIEGRAKAGDLAGIAGLIDRMADYLDRVDVVYE